MRESEHSTPWYPELVGNSFPLSLIRRPVCMVPQSLESFIMAMSAGWISFWGHENTLEAIFTVTGLDLTPEYERPVLTLNAEGFPCLEDRCFHRCWVLSPDYIPGFRPLAGSVVSLQDIRDWRVLRIDWEVTGLLSGAWFPVPVEGGK